MSKRGIINLLLVILLFVIPIVYAHFEEAPEGTTQENLQLEGSSFTILKPEKLYVGKELQFVLAAEDSSGNPITNLEVQGQIVDPVSNKDLFYTNAEETTEGKYAFTWKPSFAGDYFVQFLSRYNEQIVKPTFAVQVKDKRAQYTWIVGIIIAAVSLLLLIKELIPRKKKKINLVSVFTNLGIILLAIILAYSVALYYNQGGERGFVVCGEEGCNSAAHGHTELEMSLCGESYDLPLEAGDLDKQHTHKEKNLLHIHTLIKTDESGTEILEPEKLMVKDLFEQLSIPFNNTCFADKCNGNLCDGQAGELKFYVNNIENNEFERYVWKDGGHIKIIFE